MGNDTRAYLACVKIHLFCILMSNNKDFLDFILRTFDIIGHEEEKYKKSEADFKYFYFEFGLLRALAEKDIEKMKENINIMLEPKVARQVMYDVLSDMEYNGLYYEIDDKLIMKANGRNYYALCFQNESELKDYLFQISKEKGIENIYYIFCEYSYIMEATRYGIINIDIVNKKVTVDIKKEDNYIEIFEKIIDKLYPELKEDYEKYLDDELKDEEVEEYEDKMDEIMGKYSLKEFKKFLDKVKLE